MEKLETFKPSLENAQEIFYEARKKETLPATPVNNVVKWVNPEFYKIPFEFNTGTPTDLALFLTPQPDRYPKEIYNVMIMPEKISGRSILLENNTLFYDKEGRLYRDVDLKGAGAFLKMPDDRYIVGEVKKRSLDPNQAKGLLDYQAAIADKECTELFMRSGLRTHRVIAIVDLEEIIEGGGNKISVTKAKKRGLISEEMHPVMSVRAFGTKERLDYIHTIQNSEPEKERANLALSDAIALIAVELGKNPSEFSINDYVKWFAQTFGGQIAKIRKLGAYHGHLHLQNITLDCRITDLEGIIAVEKIFSTNHYEDLKKHLNEKELTSEIIYKSEFDGGKESLNDFLNDMANLTGKLSLEAVDTCLKLYEAEYNRELSVAKEQN